MPAGIKADVLGVEIGDSYAEAKARLQRILDEGPAQEKREMTETERSLAEMNGTDLGPPLREFKTQMFMRQPGLEQVRVEYVSELLLRRDLPGTTNRKISENIHVYLSAPSSGNQVTGISRSLSYPAPGDQPRISELVGQLKAKFGSSPQVYNDNKLFVFQFHAGQPFVPRNGSSITCQARFLNGQGNSRSENINLNPSGDCDVVMRVSANAGISPDHAGVLNFELADNERAQANARADFRFLRDYIKDLQGRSNGAAPKL